MLLKYQQATDNQTTDVFAYLPISIISSLTWKHVVASSRKPSIYTLSNKSVVHFFCTAVGPWIEQSMFCCERSERCATYIRYSMLCFISRTCVRIAWKREWVGVALYWTVQAFMQRNWVCSSMHYMLGPYPYKVTPIEVKCFLRLFLDMNLKNVRLSEQNGDSSLVRRVTSPKGQ